MNAFRCPTEAKASDFLEAWWCRGDTRYETMSRKRQPVSAGRADLGETELCKLYLKERKGSRGDSWDQPRSAAPSPRTRRNKRHQLPRPSCVSRQKETWREGGTGGRGFGTETPATTIRRMENASQQNCRACLEANWSASAYMGGGTGRGRNALNPELQMLRQSLLYAD